MIGALVGWKGYALTGLAAAVLAFGGGWTVRGWKADSDALEAKEQAEKAQLEAIKQAYDAGAATVAEEQRIVIASGSAQGRVREIYREVQVPAQCDVPDAGKRLLDEAIAATGSSPAQPDGTVPSPSPAP